ncbi:MAG: carboxymuconolactone decarboxylase family protein [Actinomycetota bacterium]|nr:carboxymuconolactone decarboxylase family protein [Actinomycetota bacterium]
MARVELVKPDQIDDPMVQAIFAWVTQMESAVPNHFYLELNFPEFMKAKLGATKVLWEAGELTMEEIQHVGIAVSRANGCPYCTAAFCTILNYGLGQDEGYVRRFVTEGAAATEDERTATIVRFAEKVNADPAAIEDGDVEGLRKIGLTDKGVVQLVHLVSDFAAYNRLNIALGTDYDYRDMWREVAFGWQPGAGEAPGDNRRGLR